MLVESMSDLIYISLTECSVSGWVIPAAAGGGGVLFVIIIIAVACCCCRKSPSEQAALKYQPQMVNTEIRFKVVQIKSSNTDTV
jgi:hypothetical protein